MGSGKALTLRRFPGLINESRGHSSYRAVVIDVIPDVPCRVYDPNVPRLRTLAAHPLPGYRCATHGFLDSSSEILI